MSITVVGPNAVSRWNEIAAATINQPAAATGPHEEQRPIIANDLPTAQMAVYDALVAITGTHRPFAVTPNALGRWSRSCSCASRTSRPTCSTDGPPTRVAGS